MSAPIRSTLAIGLTVAGVFALGGGSVQRDKPVPPAVQSVAPDGSRGGRLVVDLVDGATEGDLARIEALLGADLDWTSPLSIDEALAEGDVVDLSAALERLRGNPLVEVAEPQIEMAAFGFPDDPMYDRQWNLGAMGAPQAWSMGAMGEGIVVAVVDTGVSRVEDLEGTTMMAGASFVPGARTSADDQGHGTHVAGTIAQTTNNGKGVAGVAPQATILPVKVLSRFGFGQSSWIASGIDYAVDEGADVINLSLGGGYSAVIAKAVEKARAEGVLVVAAAGNSGRRGVSYPGALEHAIGVSATGPDGSLAPYSSFGKGVDIAAPGGDKRVKDGGILQNTIDGRGGDHYAEYQGTSMATPHVAGAAAVLLSRGVPPDEVEQQLLSSARSEGGWNERVGHGSLDLGAALGTSVNRADGWRFLLGALLAFLLAQMANTRAGFTSKSAAFGGLTAGGFFFLKWLPFPDLFVTRLLSTGWFQWPEVIFGGGVMHFPLWSSALVPLVAAFTLGAHRTTRPLALGLTAGFAAMLLHGAATGALSPWWLPASIGHGWLALNGSIAVLLGMGLAGTESLEMQERRP